MKEGRLKIFYGPMYSGKSAYLIKDILNNIAQSKLVFKPKSDERSDKVYTREGLVFDAIAINEPIEILEHVEDWVRVVYIDEINFFDGTLVDVVKQVLAKGIDVVVSGLDKDYRDEYFDSSIGIIEYADVAVSLKAKCHVCGDKSSHTARFVNGAPDSKDSPRIISDTSKNNVEYKTVCAKHHPFK